MNSLTQTSLIVSEVARIFGVRPAAIYTRARYEPVATARLVAISLCADCGVGKNKKEVARQFKRTASMVNWAQKEVADRQTVDPKFAALVTQAKREIGLRAAAEPVQRSQR